MNNRTRRSEIQLIADLESRISALKARAAAKSNPALRHLEKALSSLEAAMEADPGLRRKLADAQAAMTEALGSSGVIVPARRAVDAAAILDYVAANPGQRGEQIAAALGTESNTMRPVMRKLIEEGKVRTQGERRGMTYSKA
jgi:hypothetical protein